MCFTSSTLAPEKCFKTTCLLNFLAFQMAFPYIFFSIESSKVNDVGDFDLLFLFDIVVFFVLV